MDRGTSQHPWQWLTGIGAALVVAGGLVAAVTGPLQLAHGSWLAAYLVLVGGVAQVVIGRAPTWLGLSPAARSGWIVLAGWNLGNLGVAAGTLAANPYVVDAGGLVLLVTLVVLLRESLRRHDHPDRPGALPAAARGWMRLIYRVMLVILVISVPIGLVLAHVRAGH